MQKLLFGTAGIPLKAKGSSTINGISQVKGLGLGCMELEFVRNVNVSEKSAPEVRRIAEKEDIILSCHGQYFVNLNADDEKKIEASRARILKAARIANMCGAFSITFHMAYYMGRGHSKVYSIVKKHLKEVVEKLKSEGNNIWIRPETTGRLSQFGSFEEILQLSQELDNVLPCIDFSHLHARSLGKCNTYEEFSSILEAVEKKLGKNGLHNVHIHIAGIEYGKKGEIRHLNLKDSDMNYKDLVKAWKNFKIKGAVISESPNIESDALLLQRMYKQLSNKKHKI